jgi:hypothetical protein
MTDGVPNILEEMNTIQLRKNVNSKTVAIIVFGACENHGWLQYFLPSFQPAETHLASLFINPPRVRK